MSLSRKPLFCLVILTLAASMLLQFKGVSGRDLRSMIIGVGRDLTRSAGVNDRVIAARCSEALDKLPSLFESNQGQTDSRVNYVSRGLGYSLFLMPTEACLSLVLRQDGQTLQPERSSSSPSCPLLASRTTPKRITIRMRLVGANPHPTDKGLDESPGKSNYFLGKDSTRWRRNITTYSKVQYQNVYPGVDLIYYGNRRQLEYDFVVAPGTSPEVIELDFEGVDTLGISPSGDLALQAANQQILHIRKPSTYQDIDGIRHEISSDYAVNKRCVSFRVGAYDATKPLIIDPVLVYSTPLGGNDGEAGYAITTDSAGNVYVTGDTNSIDFPATRSFQRASNGSTDVFVAKLSANGTKVLYSTYLGGGDADVGYGIAVDPAGDIYVTGDTRSTDFPLKKPFQSALGGDVDVFVTKLSADGSRLLYSTYIGGANGERGNSLAVDGAGNAYITGYTNSTNFPTGNALQNNFGGGNADAFVLKLNSTGSALLYSTYLGGGNDRPDIGTGITTDADGNAYVTGFTNSRDFPTVKPLQPFRGPTDVFVTKLSATGSIVYSTHLGGGADDEAMAIAIDVARNVYITGHTESPDFPTTAKAFSRACVAIPADIPIGDICLGGDAFISKISSDGSTLVYSTYVSGSGFEVGRGIAVDSAGNAYVAGLTSSDDFPLVNPLQKTFGGGDFDAFVIKLNPSGSGLVYCTYLGGSYDDVGYSIALDRAGNAYVTGFTESVNFPTRNPLTRASSNVAHESKDVFITKITD